MGQIVDLYLIAYDERISNQQLLCTSLTTFRIQSSLILSINKQSQINKLNKKKAWKCLQVLHAFKFTTYLLWWNIVCSCTEINSSVCIDTW